MKHALLTGLFALLLLAACAEQDTDPNLPGPDPQQFSPYCTDGISEVHDCGDYIKAVYGDLSGGIRWYDAETGDQMDCPVVAPDSMTAGCKALMERDLDCIKQVDCEDVPEGCCEALTATCLSCAEGVSVDEYCDKHPETAGCEETDETPEGYVTCEDPRPEICTMEYNPVCGHKDNGIRCITTPCDNIDYVTYGNGCGACSDTDVYGYTPGECEEKPMALCDTLMGAFEQEKDRYECVEECPEESYGTQIGLVRCIDFMDKETFETWQPCETGKDCEGTCAYATIATDGSEVDWDEADDENGYPPSSLRCITDDYSNFMIHRGLTTVDDEGRVGTVIA